MADEDDVKIKIEVDKAPAYRQADEVQAELQKKLESKPLKLSTSVQGGAELDVFIAKLEKEGRTERNTKLNLSIKQTEGQNLNDIEKQINKLKLLFGEPNIVRVNTQQASNAFNQINNSIKDTNSKFGDLQNQISAIKITPNIDSSQIKVLQNALEDAKKDLINLSKQGIDIKADVSKIKDLEKSLAQSTKEIKQPIAVKITGDLARRELDAINSKLGAIKNITATGLVLKFSEIGLGSISSSLSQVANLAQNAFGSGFDIASRYETIQVGLQNSLINTAKNQLQANQAFASGKGTLEDYAAITGRTTDSLYKQVEATGGVAKANKSLKAELDKQKDAKRDLEVVANKEIDQKNVVVNGIKKVIDSLEKERDARLATANATDKQIEAEDKQIRKREIELDKELKKKQSELNKANKPELDTIAKRELEVRKELNTLQKKENVLNDNKKANEGELKEINNRQEILQSELSDLRLKKDTIEESINLEIDSLKSIQDAKKQQIETEKDLLEARKEQNEAIKDDFKDRITEQKDQIEALKQQIEDRKIKLDADISPIEEKIRTIQDKIDVVQNSASGGGGSGKSSVLDPNVRKEIAERNKKTKADPRFAGKSQAEIDQILTQDAIKKSSDINTAVKNYAVQSPFTRVSATNLASTLNRLGIDPLAGVSDVNDPNAITNAGGKNILNNASDLIALSQTLSPGKSSDEASNDFLRSISELKAGQKKSFSTRFNISSSTLDEAAKRANLSSKLEINKADGGFKDESFSNLSGEDFTAFTSALVDLTTSRGLANDLTKTAAGKRSNLEDQGGNIAEKFFGDPKNSNSLINQIGQSFEKITKALDDPKLQGEIEKLGNRIGKLVEEALTPENISNFADAIQNFARFVAEALSTKNIIKISGAIEDLAGFASDPTGYFSNDKKQKRAEKGLEREQNIEKTFSFEQNGQSVDPTKFLDKKKAEDLQKLREEQGFNNEYIQNGFLDNPASLDSSGADKYGITGRDDIGAKKRAVEIQAEINALLEESNKKFKDQQETLRVEFNKTADTFKSSFANSSTEVQTKISDAFTKSTVSADNFTKSSDEKLKLFTESLKTSFGTIPQNISEVLDNANLTTEQKLQTFQGLYDTSFAKIKEVGGKSFEELKTSSTKEIDEIIAKIQGSGESKEDKDKQIGLLFSIRSIAAENEASAKSFEQVKQKGVDTFDALINKAKIYITTLKGDIGEAVDDFGKKYEGKVGGKLADSAKEGLKFFLGVDGKKASGGSVFGGKNYLVGEKGPEIISMGGSGYVSPANITDQILKNIKIATTPILPSSFGSAQQQPINNVNQTFTFPINSSGSARNDEAYARNMYNSAYSNKLSYGR